MGAACRALAETELDAALEIDRYVEALARDAPAAAPRGVILYYALGGGLGHLTRARKVLEALGRDDASC